MKPLQPTDATLVIRTDFSDSSAWEAVGAAVRRPDGVFRANVKLVSDPGYDGMTVEQLLDRLPAGYDQACLFVVDRLAITQPDHPLLAVDLDEEPGRTLRVIPSQVPGMEVNLAIANMDFSEFADAAGPDGVFRGFPRG